MNVRMLCQRYLVCQQKGEKREKRFVDQLPLYHHLNLKISQFKSSVTSLLVGQHLELGCKFKNFFQMFRIQKNANSRLQKCKN